MCRNCVASYMLDLGDRDVVTDEEWDSIDWPYSTPEMRRLTAAIQRLYGFDACSVGGPLHIVTDDYNIEDASLDFCERDLGTHWALNEISAEEREAITETTREIIALMRPMTLQERVVALGRTDGLVPA